MATRLRAVEDGPCCARCASLARYARDLADAVGLRDWAVVVEHEFAPDPEARAMVRIPEGRRELHLWFCARFLDIDREEQRLAMVHELTHVHLRGVWETVEDGMAEALGGMARRMFEATLRREMEKSVDALSSALAVHLPEPPWR